MAEGILFNVIEKLIGKLGSVAVEAWNVRDDVEKLMENMSEIKAVVFDAEQQQQGGTNSLQVQEWLEKLKDALDDADDLLDDFSTEDLRRLLMTKDKKAKQVRIFFSSSNQFLFSFKMAPKIKELRKRIEALNVDRKIFNFINHTPEPLVVKQRETHSFIREEDVIGREEEKKELIKLLLNTNINPEENVSVISIIGIGGLGKTALAQLVHGDKEVQGHFELKMWVCVSDDFDVKGIAAKIIESRPDVDFDKVQRELREKVGGKRYLLVLDDIWNEDREHWLPLMTLLADGAKGSKIIVTTRSKKVAMICGTSSHFFLKGLDEKQSWKLFSRLAFENRKEPEKQNLVSIGKEIVAKCSGVPLAIRSIGSLMYSMPEEDWSNFRNKDLMKIDEQGEKAIFQLIKLSYDRLRFYLKKCFAFFSLFPKDYAIDVTLLIRLWVAQGFVQSSDESDESMCLENVGNEYFLNLAHRSFFQELHKDYFYGHIQWCKMHDLMHDVARVVAGNDYVIVNEKKQCIDKQTRHLAFGFALDSSWQVPSSLLKAYKLRTFLLPRQEDSELEDSACDSLLSSFNQLRILDLNHLNSRKMSSCIGKLNHLRYINLSNNKQIEVLPGSITKLINLQTLLLNHCSMLRELPKDIWKLISLRHLELKGCDKLTFMPRGIGKLTSLKTLTLFVLDRTSKLGGRASELRELNNLRKELEIKGLESLRRSPTEAKDMNLMKKPHLEGLTLTWDSQIDGDGNDVEKDDIILQGLTLHHNIKVLGIYGYSGMAITSSVSVNSFTNLCALKVFDCPKLQYLPQLHQLLHLKSLYLENLPSLEWIENNSSHGSSSTFTPPLEEIYLLSLPNLKGWCRCGKEEMSRGCCHQFNHLDLLRIENGPNLISFPQNMNGTIVRLKNVREKILQQAVYHSKVEHLLIESINGLKSLSGFLQHLTALQLLSITKCEELDPCYDEDGCYSMQWKELDNLRLLEFNCIPKMESLPEGLRHVTNLQVVAIANCANLTFIPDWVTSLQATRIANCPKLASLPEGVEVQQYDSKFEWSLIANRIRWRTAGMVP